MQFNFSFNRSESTQESFKALSSLGKYTRLSTQQNDSGVRDDQAVSFPLFSFFGSLSRQASENNPSRYEALISHNASELRIKEELKKSEVFEPVETTPEKLMTVLEKLFSGEQISELDLVFDVNNFSMLSAIVERKFGKKLKIQETRKELYEKLQKINSSDSMKRPEENAKFIFKHVLKTMRERFVAQTGNKRSRKYDKEKAFYMGYFKDIVEEKGVPIETFFHPRNVVGPSIVGHRTINSEYIRDISLSQKFVSDFLVEVEELSSRWHKKIQSKLKILENKILEAFKSSDPNAIAETVQYIAKNSKCKLPWTIKEVKEAAQTVKRFFNVVN